MNGFTTKTLTQKHLDLYKRVKYSMGLVLGVDEFDQEQVYFLEKHCIHNRALHGYGTVCGLEVSKQQMSNSDDIEIVVSPGIAVDPSGRNIRVPRAQCAKLNQWLTAHKDEIINEPDFYGKVFIYVLLCYKECETDKVPILGEPCRSQDDSIAPSRFADYFELSLSLTPPPQLEEDVVRLFGELLSCIEITEEPGTFTTLDEITNLVKKLPDWSTEPQPLAGIKLRLHPENASDILRAIFDVWVTQVRPNILGKEDKCGNSMWDDSCVCLAKLYVQVEIVDNNLLQVENNNIEKVLITNDDRPILLHTRLLQEWLLCGAKTAKSRSNRTFATLYMKNTKDLKTSTIRVWVHHPQLLNIQKDAVTIKVEDTVKPPKLDKISQILNTNVFDLKLNAPLTYRTRVTVCFDASLIHENIPPNISLLNVLEDSGYVYLDREGNLLLSYLDVDNPSLKDLSDVVVSRNVKSGQILIRDKANTYWRNETPDWIKVGDKAGGDLTGTYPDPTIAKLQMNPVDATNPQKNEVLTWVVDSKTNEGKWKPAATFERTFATLYLYKKDPKNETTTIRAWVHYPQQLIIPKEAVTIEVEDLVKPLGDFSQIGINVFELKLHSILKYRSRVTVYFDASLITDTSTDKNSLLKLLEDSRDVYLDRKENSLIAYLDVERPPLDDLENVYVYNAKDDDVLLFQSGRWVAAKQTAGINVGDKAGGDLAEYYPDPNVIGLQGHPIDATDPLKNGILTWNAGAKKWVPLAVLDDLEDVEAPKPKPNPNDENIYVLTRDKSSGIWKPQALSLDDLDDVTAPNPQQNEVLTWDKSSSMWKPQAVSLPHILDDLEDVDVSSAGEGNVLTWNGKEWVPQVVSTTSSDTANLLLPFVTITRLGPVYDEKENVSYQYELWFNIDAPKNMFYVDKDDSILKCIKVDEENWAKEDDHLDVISIVSIEFLPTPDKNVCYINLDHESDRMRFTFTIECIKIIGTWNGLDWVGDLKKYIDAFGINFMGYNHEKKKITAFVRGMPRAGKPPITHGPT